MGDPMRQTVIVGVVFFLVFAAFYVLQGLAALLMGPGLASNSLATLYGVFTAACLYAPYVVNRYGAKRSLRFGILGYCALSIATLLFAALGDDSAVAKRVTKGAVIFGGALNGLGAAVLWTAQGRFMLDVAALDEKRDVSEHFAVFWALFNSSAVVGGVATYFYFGQQKTSDATSNAILFAAFLILMTAGAFFTVFLEDTKVSQTVVEKKSTVSMEFLETIALLLTRRAALLGPLFWYTGFGQPYQLDSFGADEFGEKNIGLELTLFYAMSVLAGKVADIFLKRTSSKRTAAFHLLFLFFFASLLAFGCAAYAQKQKQSLLAASLAFAFWGFSTSLAQAYCYWLIDVLYDHGANERSRAVALYKMLQSLGWCVGFALLPKTRCPTHIQLILNGASCAIGAILALFQMPPAFTSISAKKNNAADNNTPLLFSSSRNNDLLFDDDYDDDSKSASEDSSLSSIAAR